MRPFLASVGVNFRSPARNSLDKAVFRDPEAFCTSANGLGISQCMVLSTCNRREAFFMAGGEADVDAMRRLYLDAVGGALAEPDVEMRLGEAAVLYFFRIAAGLESMILGEYQILGQVKAAHEEALRAGHVGKALDRIARDAISCAKRVKTELDIGAVPPSVCQAGMELVNRRFGLLGKRFFVIGSGRTGTLAAQLARKFGAKSICACNRSPERVRRLETELGARIVDYASRYAVIDESDVVVSATASPHVVVCADRLRLTHPVVFLDLASPHDVDPAVADLPFASLVGIETIGELAAGDRRERELLTARGMEIVRSSVSATLSWLEGLA